MEILNDASLLASFLLKWEQVAQGVCAGTFYNYANGLAPMSSMVLITWSTNRIHIRAAEPLIEENDSKI